MDIREMEVQTGLTRANIRFYEKEGLITPLRQENGYRDYSIQDKNTLLRIKLLRYLKVSVEDIRALQKSNVELGAVLERKLEELERQRREIVAAQKVCERICEDGIGYSELDAERYLYLFERELKNAATRATPEDYVRERDADRLVPHPYKRLAAKVLDLDICSMFWVVILMGIFCISPFWNWTRLLMSGLSVATLLLVEPLLISKWGTTPGKWLMGIQIRDVDGRKLKLSDARERTWESLWRGMGLNIPIYAWVRLFKTYKEYGLEKHESYWNTGVEYEFVDQKKWRKWAWCGSYMLCIMIGFAVIAFLGMRAPNQGELTLAQFAENYNYYNRYFYADSVEQMTEDGELTHVGAVVIYAGMPSAPLFTFGVEDGELVSVRCSADYYWNGGNTFSKHTKLTVLAYLGGQVGLSDGGVLGLQNMMRSLYLERQKKVQYDDIMLELSSTRKWEWVKLVKER